MSPNSLSGAMIVVASGQSSKLRTQRRATGAPSQAAGTYTPGSRAQACSTLAREDCQPARAASTRSPSSPSASPITTASATAASGAGFAETAGPPSSTNGSPSPRSAASTGTSAARNIAIRWK